MNTDKIMKRLETAEKKLVSNMEKLVVRDFGGVYFGDCGVGLSQKQFDAWVESQEPTVKVTVIEYRVDDAAGAGDAASSGRSARFETEQKSVPMEE